MKSPASIYLDGEWFDGEWQTESLDGDTGEVVITAVADVAGAPRVAALRMTMDLVRGLRAQAGFDGAPPTRDDTTLEQRIAALEAFAEKQIDELTLVDHAVGRLIERVDGLLERVDRMESLTTGCTRCNGAGRVANSAWADPAILTASKADLALYAQEHGEEEFVCPECDGSGHTLTARGEAIVNAVRMGGG